MSHSALEIWLAESRKKAGAVLDPGATMMPTGDPGWFDRVNVMPGKRSSKKVMVVEDKPMPIEVKMTELAPTSIIPPVVLAPTIVLVGGELGGGNGIPWTNGPGALMEQVWPLGTMLFYVGNRVAISIGIYDSGRSMENLIISKHMRNVRLRVHTGMTQASDPGKQGREDPIERRNLPVPFNRPPLPGSGPGSSIEEFEKFAEQFDEPYMRWAPDLSPMDKFKANAKDFFKFFVPNDANPFSWFQ